MTLELNKIYEGNVLDILRSWPAESVDCVVTSPPYWGGMRTYGDIEPQVWDGTEGCAHEWAERPVKWHCDKGEMVPKESYNPDYEARSTGTASGFCSLCGAWRGTLGLEPDFKLYLKHLIAIFDEIRRVLKRRGTCWVNINDTYAGSWGAMSKPEDATKRHGFEGKSARTESSARPPSSFPSPIKRKSQHAIPERFKIDMIDAGWVCANTIIWEKPNILPESVKDRFTRDFEYFFFFTKRPIHFFNQQFEPQQNKALKSRMVGHSAWNGDPLLERGSGENAVINHNVWGRNKRTTWKVCPVGYKGHFATFPPELIEVPIKSSCPDAVCTKCGKPRMRIYKTVKSDDPPAVTVTGKMADTEEHFSGRRMQISNKQRRETTGNHEDIYERKLEIIECKCGAPFVPGVVLDPFMGSGTVAVVAEGIGVNWVGIELNPKYAEDANQRIEKFRKFDLPKIEAARGQMKMFEGVA